MSEVTRVLNLIQHGDSEAADRLLPLVYDELRALAASKLALEKSGQTLQATALVHEAYLKLIGPEGDAQYDGRGHFFAAAAEAMRRLLVDRARRYKAEKHGGNWIQVQLDDRDLMTKGTPDQIVALDESLERLANEDPTSIELVKLVLFGGFTVEDAGQLLDLSRATAYRHWHYARAWIKREMTSDE